jgi:hypothetical protein
MLHIQALRALVSGVERAVRCHVAVVVKALYIVAQITNVFTGLSIR